MKKKAEYNHDNIQHDVLVWVASSFIEKSHELVKMKHYSRNNWWLRLKQHSTVSSFNTITGCKNKGKLMRLVIVFTLQTVTWPAVSTTNISQCRFKLNLLKKINVIYIDVWHSGLSRWRHSSQRGHTVTINWWTWSTDGCLIDTKRPKPAQKISPTSLEHQQQPELLTQRRTTPSFHVVYVRFWP